MDESDVTSGFGGASTSLSFFHSFFFVRTDFVAADRPQFLRYGDEIVQAHCPGGGIDTFEKNLGVRPPGGKFFSKFFSEISI